MHCGYSYGWIYGKHDKSTKMDVYQKGFTNLQERTMSWVYIKQPIEIPRSFYKQYIFPVSIVMSDGKKSVFGGANVRKHSWP